MSAGEWPDWVIFYGNKSHLTSDEVEDIYDVPGGELPRGAVVAIVAFDEENGQRVMWGTPYYLWRTDFGHGGRWVEASQDAMWLYLIRPGPKKVLLGEYVGDTDFQEILDEANNFYPRKTTWRKAERPLEGR